MADLKLIGGIGLDLNQLMRDSQLMSRVFGKQYKLMISTQGYDVVKKQLRDLITENERLQKLNTRVLKQTIDSNGMMRTTTLNRDGVKKTTTLDTSTGQIVKEIKDADSALTELNKSYGRIKKAQTEIGQIQKEYAGREKEMPASSQKRLVMLNNILAREQAYVNTKGNAIRNDEKMNALLQERKRIQYQIDHKVEKVTQAAEVEKVNTLYAEQSRLVKEIGQLQREMFTAGPKEKKVIEGSIATRQQELAQVQQQISQSTYQNTEKEAESQKQIRIEAEKTAQAEAKANDQRVRGKQALDTMYRTMVAMLTIQAIRMLRDTWREALSFVKQYYDGLNEIRIVTGYTQEQADKLADRYLKLADKMKVSALDISKMGATLYRQGLQGDDAVIGRMEAVIKYSKIAAEDVSESADLMVVAINAFQRKGEDAADTAMRVADTWTYMGDAVETEAGEIGTAMQKVVANAKVVGLSLEKTSSFIATISSATRETPEVVGTALNRIISRYEKLTQAGMNRIFTSEEGDVVAVNDVARALKVINVELYTAGEGFMTFGDVMDKVGAKWEDLSDVEQRYLATAMAGIHGINKFYALMEDYDKSLALYEGSLSAKGSANAKYAIHMESVTAAQDDMKNSLQALYNTILSGGIIKEFYEGIAGFVDSIKNGVDAIGGFNIKAIATVAIILSVTVALGKMIKVFSDIKGKGIMSLFGGGTFRTAIVALTALAGAVIYVAGKVREASDPIKGFSEEMERLAGSQEKWNDKIDDLASYKSALENIAMASKDTAEYQETFNSLMENLVKNTPSLTGALQDAKGNWVDLGTAIGVVNDRMEKNAQLRDLETRANAFRALSALPSELEGSIGDSRKAKKIKDLVDAMIFLRDNPDLSKWVDGFFKMGNNGAGARDIENFTGQEAQAYKSKVLVNTFADNDGGSLDFISAYYGFDKNLGFKPNRNALVNIIGEDLELSLAMIETLYSNSKDETKIKVMEYQKAIIDIFSTTDGYREAPSFIRGMIDQVSKDLSEEFGNIDFSAMSDEQITQVANSYRVKVYEKAKSIMEDGEGMLIKTIAGSSSPSRPPFSTAIEELTHRFGGDLLDTQLILDKYFPAEYSEKYWAEFMKRVYLGYSDKKLEDFLGKGKSPFDFLKQETARGLKEAGEALGVTGEEIQVAFDKIMSIEPDLEGKEATGLQALSNLLNNSISDANLGKVLTQLDQVDGSVAHLAATWVEWDNVTKTKPFDGIGVPAKTIGQIYDELRSVSTDVKVADQAKSLFGMFDGLKTLDEFKAKALEVITTFENMPDFLQKDVAGMFPDFDSFLGDMAAGALPLADIATKLEGFQNNIEELDFKILVDSISELEGSGQIIGGVADAFKGLKEGGMQATVSVIALRNSMNTYADAQKAYNEIIKAGGVLTEETSEYFNTLSSYSGVPAELLAKDLTPALEKLNMEMGQVEETMLLLAKQGGIDVISPNWIGQVTEMTESADPAIVMLRQLLGVIELLTGATFDGSSTFENFAAAIRNLLSTTGEDVTSWFYKLKKINEEVKAITEGSYGGMKQNMYREGGAYDKAESLIPFMDYMKDPDAETRDYGTEAFASAIRKLSSDELEVLKSEFSEVGAIIDAVFNNGSYTAEELAYAIEKTQEKLDEMDASNIAEGFAELEDAEKLMQGTYQALEDIKDGGLKGQKAMQSMGKQASAYAKAQGAANKIMEDGGKLTEENKEYFDILASHVGLTAEELNENMTPAMQYLQYEGGTLVNTMGFLASEIARAGTVNFNTAGWQSALMGMDGKTNASIGLLQALFAAVVAGGKMELKAIQHPDGSVTFDSKVPTLDLPKKTSTGGGGGSSGGVSKGLQTFLDNLSNRKELDDFTREIINLRKAYHELRGEITAMITLTKQEVAHIEKVSAADVEAEASLRAQVEAKQQQIAGLKAGSKQYKQAVEDLNALQDAHKDYSKRVLENKSDLEKLQQEMKDLRRSIRDMEIDLRDELRQAFEDRADLEQSMLDGRVEMEDQILSLIEERYQREQELINENLDKQREAYNEELKMLRENLNERKRIAEEDKKAEKLVGLENQLAMISADPTRAKERLDLQKQIAALREEISWDAAENEVKAQEDSINQQIDSLEEYQEYIDQYYEDLFKNPIEMIREMERIMKLSDEEIIAWLQASSDEFKNSSENKQLQMAQSWTETLMAMHGQTVMYWTEIEEIIKQGDDAIIAFLMNNREDYRTAGALQAQAYVDEWLDKLQALRNAYKDTQAEFTQAEEQYQSFDNTGGSTGGGTQVSGTKYGFVAAGTTYGPYTSEKAALASKNSQISTLTAQIDKLASTGIFDSNLSSVLKALKSATIMSYAKGGLVDYTGLSAVHGSKADPEAFLSSGDTRMVRGLLDALKIVIPRFSGVNSPNGSDGSFIIEEINVSVERLDNDADLEALASKIGDKFAKEILTKRGASIGNLRIK